MPLGQDADHRIGETGVVDVDLVPADLRRRGRADVRADRARDQLRAEADAEERHFAVDRLADERGLVGEPRMLCVLVGVHRAAEDHDRVVASGASSAEASWAMLTRSSRSPRSSTRSSKSPPPPVEVGSWTIESTRIR